MPFFFSDPHIKRTYRLPHSTTIALRNAFCIGNGSCRPPRACVRSYARASVRACVRAANRDVSCNETCRSATARHNGRRVARPPPRESRPRMHRSTPEQCSPMCARTQTRLVVLQFRHVRKRRVRLLLSRPSPRLPAAGTRHGNPKDVPRGPLVAATACYTGSYAISPAPCGNRRN